MRPNDTIRKKRTERDTNRVDRRKISQHTKDSLQTAISNVDDADAKQALATLYEILTGEVPES